MNTPVFRSFAKNVTISLATFAGIGKDTRAQVGGSKVAFQVVWTNNTGKRVTNVMPVVPARAYEGDPRTEITPRVNATLERKNQNDWIKTGPSQGTGMDHALNGKAGRFGLNPGESSTVEYRFQLAADNGTGRLDLEAQAFDAHRPTAALAGGTSTRPGEKVFTLRGANRTGAATAKAAPTLRAVEEKDPVGGLRPEYVVAQVKDGNGWRELPVRENCGWVEVDTTSLAGPLAAGAQHDCAFRIGTGRARVLDHTAGAVADGHPSAPVRF